MSPISVIFAGTPEFAVPCLQSLIEDPDIHVPLVITQPDRPIGRKKILTAPPVKLCALKHDIAIWQPENINKEADTMIPTMEGDILQTRPEYLVVVAYGQIVSQKILDYPTVAAINIHPSLLPRWRGASPIQHAILADDSKTGVTVQKMGIKMDAGPILAQHTIKLNNEDISLELHTRLFNIGNTLLLDVLKNYPVPKEQNKEGITYCTKLSRDNGKTDPTFMTAQEIHRHVRALNPWPGVTCMIQGQAIKLHVTSLQKIEGAYRLECKNSTKLYILSLQEPGKKTMTAQQWMHGQSS